jgi:hypothetical protein
MVDHIGEDLRDSRFELVTLAGSRFRLIDLSGVEFRSVRRTPGSGTWQ